MCVCFENDFVLSTTSEQTCSFIIHRIATRTVVYRHVFSGGLWSAAIFHLTRSKSSEERICVGNGKGDIFLFNLEFVSPFPQTRKKETIDDKVIFEESLTYIDSGDFDMKPTVSGLPPINQENKRTPNKRKAELFFIPFEKDEKDDAVPFSSEKNPQPPQRLSPLGKKQLQPGFIQRQKEIEKVTEKVDFDASEKSEDESFENQINQPRQYREPEFFVKSLQVPLTNISICENQLEVKKKFLTEQTFPLPTPSFQLEKEFENKQQIPIQQQKNVFSVPHQEISKDATVTESKKNLSSEIENKLEILNQIISSQKEKDFKTKEKEKEKEKERKREKKIMMNLLKETNKQNDSKQMLSEFLKQKQDENQEILQKGFLLQQKQQKQLKHQAKRINSLHKKLEIRNQRKTEETETSSENYSFSDSDVGKHENEIISEEISSRSDSELEKIFSQESEESSVNESDKESEFNSDSNSLSLVLSTKNRKERPNNSNKVKNDNEEEYETIKDFNNHEEVINNLLQSQRNLSEKNEKMRTVISDQENKMNRLLKETTKFQAENERYILENTFLNNKLEETVKNYQTFRTDSNVRNNGLISLKKSGIEEIKESNNIEFAKSQKKVEMQLTEKEELIKKLNERLNNETQRANQLLDRVNGYKIKLSTAADENNVLKQTIDEMKEKHQIELGEIANSSNQHISELETAIENQREFIHQRGHEDEERQREFLTKLAKAEDKVVSLTKLNEKLNTEHSFAVETKRKLKSELDETSRKLGETVDLNSKTKTKNSIMQNDLKAMVETIEKMKQDMKQSDNIMTELQLIVEKLRQEKELAEKETIEAHKRMETYKTRLKLEAKLRNDALESNKRFENENDEIHLELANERRGKQKIENEVSEAKAEISKLRFDIQILKEHIATTEKERSLSEEETRESFIKTQNVQSDLLFRFQTLQRENDSVLRSEEQLKKHISLMEAEHEEKILDMERIIVETQSAQKAADEARREALSELFNLRKAVSFSTKKYPKVEGDVKSATIGDIRTSLDKNDSLTKSTRLQKDQNKNVLKQQTEQRKEFFSSDDEELETTTKIDKKTVQQPESEKENEKCLQEHPFPVPPTPTHVVNEFRTRESKKKALRQYASLLQSYRTNMKTEKQ